MLDPPLQSQQGQHFHHPNGKKKAKKVRISKLLTEIAEMVIQLRETKNRSGNHPGNYERSENRSANGSSSQVGKKQTSRTGDAITMTQRKKVITRTRRSDESWNPFSGRNLVDNFASPSAFKPSPSAREPQVPA